MKKAVFFLLLPVTYYVAGMYRSLPLMMLFLFELLLALALCFLPRYFRRVCRMQFAKRSDAAVRSERKLFEIQVTNGGRLPAGRFEIGMSVRYCGEEKGQMRRLYGSVGGRSACSIRCEQEAGYCGLLLLRMERTFFFDYLSLFFAKRQESGEMRLAVFPKEQPLSIEFSADALEQRKLMEQISLQNAGEESMDIRWLREYRAGDLTRFIHWKQSARTQRLWIKEYEEEAKNFLVLVLDMEGADKAQLKEMSAFYEVLSAVVLGFLRHSLTVRVCWYEKGQADIAWTDVCNIVQSRDMLLRIYETSFPDGNAVRQKMSPNAMRLNLHLEWFWNNMLIYHFSSRNYGEEIAQKSFII